MSSAMLFRWSGLSLLAGGLLLLTSVEPVALLDEGMLCPRCELLHIDRSGAGGQEAKQRGDQGRGTVFP